VSVVEAADGQRVPLLARTRLALTRSRGSVGELFSGRNNGVGAIRLGLAIAVVISHTQPLGFGRDDIGFHLSGRQTNLGNMAVFGFFVLSGLLITRSARRTNIGRYAWHRLLRIYPALWVCLLVTALVVGPLIAIHEHGSTAGYWTTGPGGPFGYLTGDWWTGMRQWGIHDLLAQSTPYGRTGPVSVFDGALWSLSYEMLCYVGIGVLAVTAVLRQARRFVLFLLVATYLKILLDYLHAPGITGPIGDLGGGFTLPLIGGVGLHWLIYLGMMFLIGAAIDLYREWIPIHDGLALLAALVLAGSLVIGGFFVAGLPAFAYLLVWLSIRMPARLHRIGRKNDYSYGIYIYGFLAQQILASFNLGRLGFLPFTTLAILAAFAAAFASWHGVEKHALRLKGWTPRLPRRRRKVETTEPAVVADGVPAAPEDSLVPVPSKA
jgi:peptidoglycan/LPS O-acetylase OafA/YrhL